MNILAKQGEATTVSTELLVCLTYEKEKSWSKALGVTGQKVRWAAQ